MKKWLQSVLQRIGHNKERQEYKQRVISETTSVDVSSITHDWLKAKQLFDALKRKCHPDRFSGDLEQEATRIFQSLMQNKYNYSELLKLKTEAKEKLGVVLE